MLGNNPKRSFSTVSTYAGVRAIALRPIEVLELLFR